MESAQCLDQGEWGFTYIGKGGRKVWTFEVLEKWGHVVELDKLIHSHI